MPSQSILGYLKSSQFIEGILPFGKIPLTNFSRFAVLKLPSAGFSMFYFSI